MKIIIITDSHDNIWNLDKFFESIKDRDSDMLIHCGDFCAPFMIDRLQNNYKKSIHLVWGNTNDKESTTEFVKTLDHVTLHGDVAELEIDDKKLAVTHFPEKARELAETQKYTYVLYGHDHTKNDEMIDKTRLINSGNIMGHKDPASYAILDTKTDTLEFVEL